MLQALATFFTEQHLSAWLVGGAVRGMLMGQQQHIPAEDLDVAVDGDGVALARQFADSVGGSFVELDSARGTGRVVCVEDDTYKRLIIDFVQLRAPTIEGDLLLRDFTINAIALPIDACQHAIADRHCTPDWVHACLDPYGGIPDIAARQLRMCQPSSLRDDPLRVLRAIRLAATLHMHITPALDAAIKEAAPLLVHGAAERVRDEFMKLLAVPHAAPWLHYLDTVGILTLLFPELEPARHCDQPIVHFLPVLEHLLETVTCMEWLFDRLQESEGTQAPPIPPARRGKMPDFPPYTGELRGAIPIAVQTYPYLEQTIPYGEQVWQHITRPRNGYPRLSLLKLATLLHDNAKPQTKQPKPDGGVSFYDHQKIGAKIAFASARRLRLSRNDAEYVQHIVYNHMRPGQLRTDNTMTPRAVARFFRDTGNAGSDILLHSLADHLAVRGHTIDPEDWRKHLAWTGVLLDMHWGQPPERTQPLINGHDIMSELGIAPGKFIGELLREVQEAQAAGEIGTREEALALVHEAYQSFTQS